MFRHFTLAIFRLRNEKVSKQLYSTYLTSPLYTTHISRVQLLTKFFFVSQPEYGQCKVQKHIVVLYVINSIHISTIIQLGQTNTYTPMQFEASIFQLCQNFTTTGYIQKNFAVSKVNKKFISHLTGAQPTPSAAAATVQVSHALPAVRFSCLLRGQFPRWRLEKTHLQVRLF